MTEAVGTSIRTPYDPSRNVESLVDAAVARQDDLRTQESNHVRELLAIRGEHAKELRLAEAMRIDANRSVDVAAVNEANRNAIAQATVLANQVDTVAEALRKQVEITANAAATSLAAALVPIQADVADMRRLQYEQQGQKAATTDSGASDIAAQAARTARNAVIVAATSPFVVLIVAIATHGKF